MPISAQAFRRVKKSGWLFAAAAAFILCVADCMYRNRESDVFGEPLFWRFVLVCAAAFASFACVFLFSRFYLSAPLIAAGGVCVFLFAPNVRAPYLFVSLPAILLLFLLRYCPRTEKHRPTAAAYGVLAAAELAGAVYLLLALIASNELFVNDILPFTRWNGRLGDNYYGFVLLLFLFALYVGFALRQARDAAARPKAKQKKNEKKKKPDGAANKARDVCVWLRFAAACLFFVSAALWCLRSSSDQFLPVPSYVNLVAVFVLCGAASVPPQEARMNSKSAEVAL